MVRVLHASKNKSQLSRNTLALAQMNEVIMSQSVGWIKLHRNIRYSFSHDRKLNRDLYDLYVYLASEASYQDGLLQTKGQIITTSTKLQRDWFHDWYVKKIQRYLKRLHDDKWIILSKATQRDQDGYCIEICSFDTISGKIKRTVEKDSCFDSVLTKSSQCPHGVSSKHSESLSNNDGLSSQCPHGVLTVSAECPHDEVFLYREEEKEKEKESNTFCEQLALSPMVQNQIINNDPISKPKKKAPEGKSVELINVYKAAYLKRYMVEPVINAKVRKQACDLIDRVGKEPAIKLIRFYLTHNGGKYLSNAHGFGLCLYDAEKLHTEMLKQDYIFSNDVKKLESASANSALLGRLYNNVE